MSNGPGACIAETVKVNIPRPRQRGKIIDDPGYYKIRKHLIKFLVERSADFSGENARKSPVEVDPTQD